MKVALVGYGRWGKNIYNTLNNSTRVDEILICDPALNKTNLKKEINFNEILRNKKIEAVLVATPATTHFEITKKLLEANKNVFCEKPLCFSTEEAVEISNLINQSKATFVSGHTYLFNDTLNFVKNYIQNNNLDFKTISGKYCSLGTNILDVDVLWDLGPHAVSISNYLFDDKPDKVTLIPTSYTKDNKLESCFLNLIYKSQNVMFELSWINIIKKREIEFNGIETSIRWNDIDIDRPIEIIKSKVKDRFEPGVFAHLHSNSNSFEVPAINPEEPLKNELNYFIDSVKNNNYKNLRSGIDFSVDVIEVLEEASYQVKN